MRWFIIDPLLKQNTFVPATIESFYPLTYRRTRQNASIRAIVRETSLCVDDLILPLFILDGENRVEPIASMPKVMRYSPDRALEAINQAAEAGIRAVALFPCPMARHKTPDCAWAWHADNAYHRAVRAVKQALPHMVVIGDVALDPYNSYGHDGLVDTEGRIVNNTSVHALVKMALAQAEAGVDIVAPSDMMDGRIGAIRSALNAAGYDHTAILSYAVKYASHLYGPFRDAVGAKSALQGDKKTYQLDSANVLDALQHAKRDIREGADMILVKPGMLYLDVCYRVAQLSTVPVFAYQVSGEYTMITAAAARGWIDGDLAMLESLLAFKRAGCCAIMSYFAVSAARFLQRG